MSIQSKIAHNTIVPLIKKMLRWQLSHGPEGVGEYLKSLREVERSELVKRFQDRTIYPRTKITRIDEDLSDWIEYEHIIPPPSKSSILYLHGGGYLTGLPAMCRTITVPLCQEVEVLYAPYYRKPPEYPFPTPLEDALEAYEKLVKEVGDNVVIIGDSAGGGLAMSLYLMLKRNERFLKLPLPRGLVLISPWLDISGETTFQNELSDHILPIESMKLVAGMYTTGKLEEVGEHVKVDPLISPLHPEEGDSCWENMVPTLVQYAEDEALSGDAHRLKELVGDAIELDEIKNGWHCCHYAGESVPEAWSAIERICRFVAKVVK